MLSSWLSADRNDASIAREANLGVSTELVEKLHTTASTTEHLLWDCPRFQDVRTLPPPQELLVARLGWGASGVNHPCVSQMGRIRERACAANRRRSTIDEDDIAALNFGGAADNADSAAF